jgi:hypothetical protein
MTVWLIKVIGGDVTWGRLQTCSTPYAPEKQAAGVPSVLYRASLGTGSISNDGTNAAIRKKLCASADNSTLFVFPSPRTRKRVKPRSRASAFTHSAVEARSL